MFLLTNYSVDFWDIIFSPFTRLFEGAMGNGGFFYVFIVIVLAIALQLKVKNIIFTSVFVIAVSGILSIGSYLSGVSELGMLFTIFLAIGITLLVIEVILKLKR